MWTMSMIANLETCFVDFIEQSSQKKNSHFLVSRGPSGLQGQEKKALESFGKALERVEARSRDLGPSGHYSFFLIRGPDFV